jgi:hypothetical protein
MSTYSVIHFYLLLLTSPNTISYTLLCRVASLLLSSLSKTCNIFCRQPAPRTTRDAVTRELCTPLHLCTILQVVVWMSVWVREDCRLYDKEISRFYIFLNRPVKYEQLIAARPPSDFLPEAIVKLERFLPSKITRLHFFLRQVFHFQRNNTYVSFLTCRQPPANKPQHNGS